MDTVPMSVIASVMGVPITITRPVPDNTPIETTGIWTVGEPGLSMFGTFEERRGSTREPRRVLAIPRDVLADIPKGTQIDAAEYGADGELGPVKHWIADGYEHSEPDHHRVFVIPA